MTSIGFPNLVAWETESAVQQLEAAGFAVSIVPTKPPRIKTDMLDAGRVIRQRLIGGRLVELVVAGITPGTNDGTK